ncbi:hypothetical protein [Cardinium endosymbiont of Culicoides punctatus]|uniref:hypothetical protein n=1 Tax=Cardinium endosymbiont of Culicoides punctatus TaxID=2304601 RepID=UPI001058A9CC|nr:hypothetical protein [Cardinium endosymbiont of Culicoides punctatus]TDG95537.1 hypothetical protein CCPUN_02730 [Cardinium endosymbiont of Culicoides punctatus]
MPNIPIELDYSFLKGEGINYIRQLAGKKWTDYGDHDPGITILEVLCFAIMDLEYRTNFYIEDLWANDPNRREKPDEKLFYKAEEILPCNPLTKWDFLKIVLDVPGVKNANIFLSDGPQEIKGGYKIFVDVEERAKNKPQEIEILDEINKRLHDKRNLCEDFFLIQPMKPLDVRIKATFEVHSYLSYEEGEAIIAQILHSFQEFLFPRIPFYSISQLLEKGRTIDQIFTGPLLTQGFIDEQELIYVKNRPSIYVAELLEKATMLPSIKGILDFDISIDGERNNVIIQILSDQALSLNIPQSDISLSYNGMPLNIEWTKVLQFLEDMKGRGALTKTYLQEEEIFVLEGAYRNIKDYVSIQQDFPLLYNVGHEGCTPSETDDNQAKSKQLKSYLMFFDQIFASYFGQLSNIKHTMAIYSDDCNNPDGQLPLDVPRMDTIIKQITKEDSASNDIDFVVQRKFLDLKSKIKYACNEQDYIPNESIKEYISYINAASESDIRSLDKRSRLLDHMLAYFAERFTTYSLHLYYKSEEERLDMLNTDKALFLKDYVNISGNRNRATDISKKNTDDWIHYRLSGFERRLYRNLGIKRLEKRFLHEIVRDNLYFEPKSAQHAFDIFLGKNHQTEYNNLFIFNGKYKNIRSLAIIYGMNEAYYHIVKNHNGTYSILLYVDKAKKHTIELAVGTHPLVSIEQAESIIQQSVELFRSFNEESEGFHLIEHILLRESDTLTSEQDPYSFRMTMVFPSWPTRFQQYAFRRFVEEMIATESPAHILTNILWLDFEDMENFEQAYKYWLTLKTDPQASQVEVNNAAEALMHVIEFCNEKPSICLYT